LPQLVLVLGRTEMRISHGTFQGAIAVLSIIGTFSLAFTQLILHGNAEIPPWAASISAGIVAFYFGASAAVRGVVQGGNGMSQGERDRRASDNL
jgi:hypothetical protein